MIHLTNDAVQKKGEEYGKFENGNKVRLDNVAFINNLVFQLSFNEFQRYLDNQHNEANINFMVDCYPQMKVI